jgi:protein-S-isoprenylcysteine O-methyltransferase Ste14
MSPIVRRIIQLFVLVLIQALVLFISAGSFTWAAGWWYIGLYFGTIIAASLIFLPKRPEVVIERSKGSEGGKPWDILLTRLIAIPAFGLLIISGLDERWGWTAPLPLWSRLLGGTFFMGGYVIVLWAMYTNKYFSQIVRVQSDRGHVAVTDGPYRIVRHPGYLGMLLSTMGVPLLLDSLYAFICVVLYAVILITRITFEDRTLHDELPGYIEYQKHTRYKLIPGIW